MYRAKYREAHQNLIAPPPAGAGFPPILTSSYLTAEPITCYLAPDGAAVIVGSYEATAVQPPELSSVIVIDNSSLPRELQIGTLPPLEGLAFTQLPDGARVQAGTSSISLGELLARLTFGSFMMGSTPETTPFWIPNTFQYMVFGSAQSKLFRSVLYLELLQHRDIAAWDPRSINVRARHDARNDFATVLGKPDALAGRLLSLAADIASFRALLDRQPPVLERELQLYIEAHPLLIDVYGTPVNRPRWYYPDAEHPGEKDYVEPDFVVVYPGNRYRLVELERPEKPLITRSGHPRAELTQAAFQVAEWRDFIARYYANLKGQFHNISADVPATVVIGRSTLAVLGGVEALAREQARLRLHFKNLEVLTYDDLLLLASQMYGRIMSVKPIP